MSTALQTILLCGLTFAVTSAVMWGLVAKERREQTRGGGEVLFARAAKSPLTAARRLAYATYATTDAYLCSALVNFRRLRALGVRDEALVVVVTRRYNRTLATGLRRAADRLGVVVHVVQDVQKAEGIEYYQDVFVKFRVLELEGYDRILFFDADCIFLKTLRELFDLPSAPLIAPRSWWLDPCKHKNVRFTSWLMVLEPRHPMFEGLWDLRRDRWYDMDILNEVFGPWATLLSPLYSTLVAHWEKNRIKPFAGSMDDLFEQRVHHVHFSFPKKPWSFPRKRSDAIEVLKEMAPEAHPDLFKIFGMWWDIRDEVCG